MLTTSQEVAELAAALSKAQGAFPSIPKGKTARVRGESKKSGEAVEYSYAYADLADILDAVRRPLAENGLSIIQPVISAGEDATLVTRLLHASGQWIESTWPLEMYDKPQETGSALTYARRYAATSLLGIAAEEDDDGQAAQGGTKRAGNGGSKRPDCPKCGNSKAVIEGKEEFGGGWLCFKKKNGCGATWYDATRPAPTTDATAAPYDPPVETKAPSEPPPAGCAHCGSVNVQPELGAPNWFRCLDCNRGTKRG